MITKCVQQLTDFEMHLLFLKNNIVSNNSGRLGFTNLLYVIRYTVLPSGTRLLFDSPSYI